MEKREKPKRGAGRPPKVTKPWTFKKGTGAQWSTPQALELLKMWGAQGKTHREICEATGLCRAGYYKMLKVRPQIMLAIKEGRKLATAEVESALLKTAKGYRYKEKKTTTVFEVDKTGKKGKPVSAKTEEYEKESPPHVGAIAMWLYNRAPKKWKRVPDDEAGANDKNIRITIRKAEKKK